MLGILALPAGGEVWFSDLDLTQKNKLLFRAEVEGPGFGAYQTLFAADLDQNLLRQLTFFPERVALLESTGVLQIQNRYGVFRSDGELKNVQPVSAFPSFVSGGQVESGKLNPLQPSPNGRFLLYLRPKSAGFGELVLLDLQSSTETVIAAEVELSLQSLPAGWSPDSAFFVYSRQNRLYYFSISQLQEKRVLNESYRQIGAGTIRNARWGAASALYYVSGTLVYWLDSQELFTRALYAGYLPIGRLAGKIPFDFDPNFDDFWIAPDGKHILLNKGGRNLFLYPLATEDFTAAGDIRSLPYLYLPRSYSVKRVLWTRAGTITLLTEGRQMGQPRSAVFRLQGYSASAVPAFQKTADQGIMDLQLSPDEGTVAAVQADGIALYSAESWARQKTRPHPMPIHVLWSTDEELVVAGTYFTELWNLRSGESRLISFSQPGKFSFSEDEQSILLENESSFYRGSLTGDSWAKTGLGAFREKKVVSDAYRVYLEQSPDRMYRNRVMVRDMRQYLTRSPLEKPAAQYEPFPPREEAVDFSLFAHGSRIRRRELALVFNAVDSIEGLPAILGTLSEYKIRATFFVNGEVIRRYPDAVREIAEAGHEVGSLFYAYFNMTDSHFQVDREFIKKGLARNEDDYFAATGRELALLWHAPYYFVSSEIIAASREMNYTYVSRDLDSLDWVTTDLGRTAPDIYLPSARLVERMAAQKKPGSIVPILAGTPAGQREDYLFQKLDLLIDALLRQGYSVVSVSTLMEHAR